MEYLYPITVVLTSHGGSNLLGHMNRIGLVLLHVSLSVDLYYYATESSHIHLTGRALNPEPETCRNSSTLMITSPLLPMEVHAMQQFFTTVH